MKGKRKEAMRERKGNINRGDGGVLIQRNI